MSHVYLYHPALYAGDDNPESFKWIDADNRDQSVFVYERKCDSENLIIVLNLTPNAYTSYRIGVPYDGTYTEILNSDKDVYGGSNLYN